MFFEISWLVQVEDENQEEGRQERVNWLVEWNSWEEIKEVLKKSWVVVFSVNQYNSEPTEFGKVYFYIKYEEKAYKCIIPYNSVREWYNFLNGLWIKPDYINSLVKPISDDKVPMIIKKLDKEIEESESKKKTKKSQKKSKEDDFEVQVDENVLNKVRNIVEDTLSDAEDLSKKVDWVCSPSRVKTFNNKIWELKKMRMWKNVEKMSVLMEEVLAYMETLEEEYFEKLKQKEYDEVWWSVVSNLDFIKEYDKYKRAKKIQDVSRHATVKKVPDDHYYWTLWKYWIYLKFLWRELKEKVQDYSSFLYYSITVLEVFFIFLLIEFWLYYLYVYYLGNGLDSIYFYIWNVGLVGLIFFILKFLRKNNAISIIVIYSVAIVLFFLIRALIMNTFAL